MVCRECKQKLHVIATVQEDGKTVHIMGCMNKKCSEAMIEQNRKVI